MKLIVCLDDKGGMAFNGRRQSRDRVLYARMLALAQGSRLLVQPGAEKLFDPGTVTVSADFAADAGAEDYCFVELCAPSAYAPLAGELVLCKWNRVYPADLYFDIDLAGWTLCASEEFAGSSHQTITMEVYRK